MKGSKLLIVGGLVITTVIAYEVYKHYQSSKESCKECTSADDSAEPKQNDDPPAIFSEIPVTDTYKAKESAAASVKERHFEAAKDIEESLNTIFKENNDATIVSEHSSILNQTNSDLNDLLK